MKNVAASYKGWRTIMPSQADGIIIAATDMLK